MSNLINLGNKWIDARKMIGCSNVTKDEKDIYHLEVYCSGHVFEFISSNKAELDTYFNFVLAALEQGRG